MRWVIKCPAPSDSRRKKWGDFHFARALDKYLTRAGVTVEIHYDPDWARPDADRRADVVLVLRGRHDHPLSQRVRGPRYVMWNISHPASVSSDEYSSYDAVFIASHSHAEHMDSRVGAPCVPLLQATDPEEFFAEPHHDRGREQFVFVGNTRGELRPVVAWAVDYGIPLNIWGRGWDGLFEDEHVAVLGSYLPNEQLGHQYRTARATFNDHWPDMRAHGFVNNRIFDALACGLPVVSDDVPALADLGLGGVLLYRGYADFESRMEELLLDYPTVLAEAAAGSREVRESFSFASRVEQLMATVAEL